MSDMDCILGAFEIYANILLDIIFVWSSKQVIKCNCKRTKLDTSQITYKRKRGKRAIELNHHDVEIA